MELILKYMNEYLPLISAFIIVSGAIIVAVYTHKNKRDLNTKDNKNNGVRDD